MKRLDTEKAAFLSDIHIPYQDKSAVAVTLDFLKWFGPDSIYILGDLLDCYGLSSFDKNPDRLLSLPDEFDQGYQFLLKLRLQHRRATIVFQEGNHEDRSRKFLWKNPVISKLPEIQIPSLLKLDSLNIDHYPYQSQLQWHGLVLEHGDRVLKHSCYTAKAMLESRGRSGLSGHTHRLGAFYKRDLNGVQVWFENGSLCDLSPEYALTPNWAHGFSVGYALDGDERFHVVQIPVLSGRIYFDGRVWSA